jgi:hypothetical protein
MTVETAADEAVVAAVLDAKTAAGVPATMSAI